MQKLKKILFWITSPIVFVGFLIMTIIKGTSETCLHFMHMYEAWCFNYHKNWEYLGDGWWRNKE